MATANNEFFEALSALEKERGLPEDYLIDKIKAAIVIAVKKDYEVEDDNVVVDIDPELGAFRASLLRDIVEEVENPHTQVSLEDAQKYPQALQGRPAHGHARSRPRNLAALLPRPQSTSSVRACVRVSATCSAARCSPAHMS